MASRAQPWRSMTLGARLYITVVVALGSFVLAVGAMHPTSHQPAKFACYLVVAVAASRLKVNLPGITGTMSVNFLFILLGILELSFGQTLALGCTAILVQCVYRDRPQPVQIIFNICATAIAIGAAYAVYHLAIFHGRVNTPSLLLVITASTYFVCNTVPVAAVIALTEHKSLRKIWSDCYFWSFPYYLVGAGVAGLMSWMNTLVDWQMSLLVLPVIYLIYRSYRLYLG